MQKSSKELYQYDFLFKDKSELFLGDDLVAENLNVLVEKSQAMMAASTPNTNGKFSTGKAAGNFSSWYYYC